MSITISDIGKHIVFDSGDSKSRRMPKSMFIVDRGDSISLSGDGKSMEIDYSDISGLTVTSNAQLYQFLEDMCLDDFENVPLISAKRRIYADYGDYVSINKKNKSLLKFGRNVAVPTTGATLMTLGGSEVDETYATTNAITHFASSSSADTSLTITVEGHTIAAGVLTFVTQTVTSDASDGRTKTALTTAIARCTRAYVSGTKAAVGAIYFSEDVAYTAGVPQTDTAVHLVIRAGRQQSEKASTSISYTDYWIVTKFWCDVLTKTTSSASIELQMRKVASTSYPFRKQAEISASNSARGSESQDPYFVVPKNSDVRLKAYSSGASVDVAGAIDGYLALVIGSA